MDTPKHVAIIMDGNGRWAESRSLSRIEGHRQGVEVVDRIVDHAQNIGVKYLTLYAFSSENWKRPSAEVDGLMELLVLFLKSKLEKMKDNGICLKTIGNVDRFKESVLRELTHAVEYTQAGDQMTLLLALSYGARAEIVDAVNWILKKKLMDLDFQMPITEEELSRALYTESIPDPDLLIRTSGECRISNYMLWQLAYTEFYFTPTFWPDFSVAEFDRALDDYRNRERRFGKTSQQINL